MAQLVVHIRKEGAKRPQPAYAIWVSDTGASVRAFGPEWEESANRLAVVLKSAVRTHEHPSLSPEPLRLGERR
jgi:hypothetical protein